MNYLPYEQITSEKQFRNIESKLLELFEVDLNIYSIAYVENLFALQAIRNIDIFTVKLLLLYLRLMKTVRKDHKIIKNFLKSLQADIERRPFNYQLLSDIDTFENQMKIFLERENAMDDLQRYKCCEVDHENLKFFKDKIYVMYLLKEIIKERKLPKKLE